MITESEVMTKGKAMIGNKSTESVRKAITANTTVKAKIPVSPM